MTDTITPKVRSVENMVKRAIEKIKNKGGAILRKNVTLCVALVTSTVLTACEAKEPEMVRLSSSVLNYSQESIAFVYVDGQRVGGGGGRAKIGDVTGGGQMCCFQLPLNAKTIEVTIDPSKGEAYKTQATIEHPLPSLMHVAIIHILPGKKIVIDVTPGSVWPRKDLIEGQIKALGLKQEVPYSDLMEEKRPEYTEYYKPK